MGLIKIIHNISQVSLSMESHAEDVDWIRVFHAHRESRLVAGPTASPRDDDVNSEAVAIGSKRERDERGMAGRMNPNGRGMGRSARDFEEDEVVGSARRGGNDDRRNRTNHVGVERIGASRSNPRYDRSILLDRINKSDEDCDDGRVKSMRDADQSDSNGRKEVDDVPTGSMAIDLENAAILEDLFLRLHTQLVKDSLTVSRELVEECNGVGGAELVARLVGTKHVSCCELAERLMANVNITDKVLELLLKTNDLGFETDAVLLFWQRCLLNKKLPHDVISMVLTRMETSAAFKSPRFAGCLFAFIKSNAAMLKPHSPLLLFMLKSSTGVMVAPAIKAVKQLQ